MGVDPFKILLQFAAGDWEGLGYEIQFDKKDNPTKEHLITKDLRNSAAKEASQYLHSKRKSIEIDMEVDDKREFSTGAYEEYIKCKNAERKKEES